MDPVAHTLFGATLAEAGLKRRSRYATATLVIGANLPDIDAVAMFWERDVELHFRRGLTHGIVALVVLPLLLALVVRAWDRWRGRGASDPRAPPFDAAAILGLAFLAVWSHPLLDWLNTYGVRLFMPFDGRWFYGDTLFIIDPWFWLVGAAGVVLARPGTVPWNGLWLAVAALATWLVLSTDVVGTGVKAGWLAGVLAIAALRWRSPRWAAGGALARSGLVLLLVYIGIAYGLARFAEGRVAQRFPGAREVQANPVPGIPGAHRVVVMHDGEYRIVASDGVVHVLPREKPDAVVRAALASPAIRGFANWMRYPFWKVEELPDRWIVRIWDLRYQNPERPSRGIGFARVEVPKSSVPAR